MCIRDSPQIVLNNVDFPLPFPHLIIKASPLLIVNDKFENISLLPLLQYNDFASNFIPYIVHKGSYYVLFTKSSLFVNF